MENLNAEQVKKDLQKIVNNYSGSWTRYNILSNALALINSQEQRIKELTEENERLRAEKETLEIYNKDYKYKNKELTAFNRRWAKECADLQDECEYIKSDTVRKMQERLDKHFCHDPAFLGVEQRLIMDVIDQIAKEMLEGENNG